MNERVGVKNITWMIQLHVAYPTIFLLRGHNQLANLKNERINSFKLKAD